jgi:perosamine synthetase
MIPISEPLLAGNELDYVRDCIATGWISSAGNYVTRFEQCWADYCGMKHGIAVSSGTAALQVAVDALRLGPGDEIIMPAFTIISCALAVIRAGAVPVLVDSDPHTYCIDVDQVTAAITSRTRALMPVHIYGHPVDMDPLAELAEKRGLAIIEDAAEAHGCEYLSHRHGYAWRRCGGLGTLSTFSFYANKLVTTGEGGMVLTNSDELAERSRSLRNLCFQQHRFYHEELGYNYRFSNLQAALGLAQTERLTETLNRKRRIGALYDALLANVSGIKLPPRRDWATINYWMYNLVLDDDVAMDAFSLAMHLKAQGIETRLFFMGLHQQPALRARGLFENLQLPVAERLSRRGLCLPSGAGLTDQQVRQVAQAVETVLVPARGRHLSVPTGA